jgi:hypothetical protein
MKLPLNLVGAFALVALVPCVGYLHDQYEKAQPDRILIDPEKLAKQEESWASSFEGQLSALARRAMPPSTPTEGPVYAHPEHIQYGKTLTARENLAGIPFGTPLHPVRFTYSNSATLDAYWYKDEFDELKLLVKR